MNMSRLQGNDHLYTPACHSPKEAAEAETLYGSISVGSAAGLFEDPYET